MADASNIFRQYSQSFVYVSKAKAVRPQAALSILYKAYRVLFASNVEKAHSSLTHLEICGIIKTGEPRTLDFSGVRGFLVTNVCIVQRSAA